MQLHSRGSPNPHACQSKTASISCKLRDYINSEVFFGRGYRDRADSLDLYHPNAFVSASKRARNTDTRRLIQVSKRRRSNINIIDQLSLKSKSSCQKSPYHLPLINLSRSRPLPPITRTIQTHPKRNLHPIQPPATLSLHHLNKLEQPILELKQEITVGLSRQPKEARKKEKSKQCLVTKEGWNHQSKGNWLHKFDRVVL